MTSQTEPIQFFVLGIPRPGGSKKGIYNARLKRVLIIKAGGQNEENWRQAVSAAALQAMGDRPPIACAVRCDITFVMPRPKGHYRTGKHADELRENAPTEHINRPDRGKLLRSTEDAMTGIVWRDDSQVCDGRLQKLYGERPGAAITVTWAEQREKE